MVHGAFQGLPGHITLGYATSMYGFYKVIGARRPLKVHPDEWGLTIIDID